MKSVLLGIALLSSASAADPNAAAQTQLARCHSQCQDRFLWQKSNGELHTSMSACKAACAEREFGLQVVDATHVTVHDVDWDDFKNKTKEAAGKAKDAATDTADKTKDWFDKTFGNSGPSTKPVFFLAVLCGMLIVPFY